MNHQTTPIVLVFPTNDPLKFNVEIGVKQGCDNQR